MNKKNSASGGRTSSASSSAKRSTPTGVSSARLHQKTGSSNAFGGFQKTRSASGNFYMKKSR